MVLNFRASGKTVWNISGREILLIGEDVLRCCSL
jgi:hypothetical protein